MKKVHHVLKWQMIRLFCIFGILSLTGMLIFLALYNPLLKDKTLQKQYTSMVKENVESIGRTVSLAGDLIEQELNHEQSPQHYQRLLNEVMNMNEAFVNAYYIDEQENLYVDHNKTIKETSVYDNMSPNTGESDTSEFYTSVYYDESLKSNLITVAHRVSDATGMDKGWVGVDIKINPLIRDLQYKINRDIYVVFEDGQVYSSQGIEYRDESNESFFNSLIPVAYTHFSIMIKSGRGDHLLDEMMINVPAMLMSVLIIILFGIYCYSKYVNMMKRIENDFESQNFNDESEEIRILSQLQIALHEQIEEQKRLMAQENIRYDQQLAELLSFEEESQKEAQYIENLKEEVKSDRHKIKRISDELSAMVWIADKEDRLLYVNDQMREQIDHQNPQHVSDMVEDYQLLQKTFSRRNFHKIKLKLKSKAFEDTLEAKTRRITLKNKMEVTVGIMRLNSYETQMYNNYLKKSRDLHFINEVSKIINDKGSIDQILQSVIDKVAFLGNYNSCTIRLLNEDNALEIKALSGYSKAYVIDDKIGSSKTHMWHAMEKNEIVLVNTPDQVLFQDESIRQLIKEGQSIIYYPLANYDKKFGMLTIISDVPFTQEIRVLLESISINITVSLEKILIFNELKANYFKTVEAFVTAAEIKAERYSGHSRRVAELCKIMAQKLFLSDEECDEIFITGLLHDVGKLAFSDDEYESDPYGDHPIIGRRMVENVGVSSEVLDGIEHHHEDYVVHGREQSYYAQFVRLANDFDLYMSQTRQSLSFFDAYELAAGTTYSPQLFSVLKNTILNHRELMADLYKL